MEQIFSNASATIQFLNLDGSRHVREVRWSIREVGDWMNLTGSESISGLKFNVTEATCRSWLIPTATSTRWARRGGGPPPVYLPHGTLVRWC